MEEFIKTNQKETITRKEVLQVLIPIAAVVFLFVSIFVGQTFVVPRVKRAVSYQKIIKKTIKEGDVLKLGKYDWNNTWRVLKVEDDRVLVINEDCIDVMNMDGNVSNYDPHLSKCFLMYPYIPQDAEIHHAERWKHTGLKKWLNDIYFDVTFNDEEKALFCDTEYGKIFILSSNEAREYFKSDRDRTAQYIRGNVSWWLRSSSSYENNVYNDYVSYTGKIDGKQLTKCIRKTNRLWCYIIVWKEEYRNCLRTLTTRPKESYA